MFYLIYQTKNTLNGKIYVGAHKTKNIDDDYYGSGVALRRAIQKYGISNFEKTILHIFDNKEAMYSKEAEIVNEEFVKSNLTYNMTLGGHGGFYHIDSSGENNPMKRKEVAKKVSKAVKQHYKNHPERIQISINNLKKAIEKNRGKKRPEHANFMKEYFIKLKNQNTDAYIRRCEKISAKTSKLWKDEKHRSKTRRAMKDAWTTERKQKQSKRFTGKNNIRYSGDYITPNGTFDSLKEACLSHNISKSALTNRCKYNNSKTISERSLMLSNDYDHIEDSDLIGKTWKEVGYGFDSK